MRWSGIGGRLPVSLRRGRRRPRRPPAQIDYHNLDDERPVVSEDASRSAEALRYFSDPPRLSIACSRWSGVKMAIASPNAWLRVTICWWVVRCGFPP